MVGQSHKAALGMQHYTETLREQYLPSRYSSAMIFVVANLKMQNGLENSKQVDIKQGHGPVWLLLCRPSEKAS